MKLQATNGSGRNAIFSIEGAGGSSREWGLLQGTSGLLKIIDV